MSELNTIFTDPGIGSPLSYPCPSEYIQTDPDKNTILFTVQEGPIKENGVNGCQVDDIVWAAATILRHFNGQFPCRENSCAITHLDEAMMWLEKRKRDREARGVEGINKA